MTRFDLGQGPPLHFAHANGFPPQAYRGLLERLAARFHVRACEMRPLWENSDPFEVRDWSILAADLIGFVEQHVRDAGGAAVVGVGHSLGGTLTLMAALDRPDLFRRLVLIDPPFFPPWLSLVWRGVFRLGLAYRVLPLVPAALNRRRTFASQQAMFDHYRKKAIFRQIADPQLWDYVRSLSKPEQNGRVTLRYPPEWEARIYATSLIRDRLTWRKLPGLQLPTLIIRPEHTRKIFAKTDALLRRQFPHIRIHTVPDSTHMLPLERPKEVARMVEGRMANGG